MSHPDQTSNIIHVLESWLQPRLDPQAQAWLNDRVNVVAAGDRKALYLSFGLAARKIGKTDLALQELELADAEKARPGWNPKHWTTDQAARALLVLSFPASDAEVYAAVVDQLFAAAEVNELVALYQGLPLFPHQPAFQLRCAEGLRTNMKPVFLAIAHHNPFPSEQLNEDQWNQLVLKSVFIGVPLDPIVGLDERANAKLARILVDFAEERWAAGRPVTPELWRCVGPFADEAVALSALERVLTTGSDLERQAATLALSANSMAKQRIECGSIQAAKASPTWKQIADARTMNGICDAE
jgi:hypothetical protein